MSDLAFKSATDLAKGIQKKKFSSLELTELYIDRIEQHDGEINAVVVRVFDRALDDARCIGARKESRPIARRPNDHQRVLCHCRYTNHVGP